MAKVKVRRTMREELPGVAVLRNAASEEVRGYAHGPAKLDLELDLDPDLAHLIAHDPDGFFSAFDRDETLGFAACHIRSRQWVLSELWVLPQHRERGAGEALLERALAYGERSGAKEYLAIVPAEGAIQSLMLRHGFQHASPVWSLEMTSEAAAETGAALSRLLPGQDVTSELLQRRGQADLDRIDRLTRNVTRDGDHVYWLKERHFRAAVVRQGQRIAAYGYGSAVQVGPIAGATPESTLCALGWAMQLAVERRPSGPVRLLVPGRFETAVETLLEAGARLTSTFSLFGRDLQPNLARYCPGTLCLP